MKKMIITAAALVFALSGTAAYAATESQTATYIVASTSAANEEAQTDPAENSAATSSAGDTNIFYGAETGNNDVIHLEKHYGKNGYPDYISYIICTGVSSSGFDPTQGEPDGGFAETYFYDIGLTEKTQENMDAVLAVASDNCNITFYECDFSYNEREAAFNELGAKDYKGAHIMMSQESQYILIYIPDDADYKNDIPLYDGMVKILSTNELEYDTGIGTTGTTGATTGFGQPEIGYESYSYADGVTAQDNTWVWFAVAGIAVFAVVGAVFIIRRNNVRINSDGSAEAVSVATKADVEKAVSDSAEAPSAELKNKIMKNI
ncbi:MAG: hypothetical protein IJZ95_04805 [Oscillospiraceae bacterium]|nr:hypothetical protein [Oscillospiraceae bacterium]